MSKRIHVLINGEQFGPYPESEFRQHVTDRKILQSDLVWRESLADWISAGELLATLDADPSIVPPAASKSAFEETRSAAERGDAEAQFKLALGAMTWPHLMVRGMLMEQLYRAQQILAGHPYHRP